MKDVKVDKFVKFIAQGKSAIEASKEADIDNYTIDEVLTELSKEDYESDWNKLAKAILEVEDDQE